MRFAHMILSQSGRDVETVCGQSCRLGPKERLSARFTMWNSLITCKRCLSTTVDRQQTARQANEEAASA